MIALATVLSMIKVYQAPYGGSLTLLSMAPLIVLAMRRGTKVGLAAAFVRSLICLLLGFSDVMWVPTVGGIVLCILFDYIFAFTVLGLGGIFRNVHFSDNETTNLIIASVLGALVATGLRFLCHVISPPRRMDVLPDLQRRIHAARNDRDLHRCAPADQGSVQGEVRICQNPPCLGGFSWMFCKNRCKTY